jgi:hypothetical protein
MRGMVSISEQWRLAAWSSPERDFLTILQDFVSGFDTNRI